MDNAKSGNSSKFGMTIESYRSYVKLTAKFYAINAMLLSLQFKVNHDYIKELSELGYKISTANSKEYADSILRAFNKAKNINSKIESKKIELTLLSEASTNDANTLNFDYMISTMSFELGFQVSEKISLVSYNAYGNIIKNRNEHRSKG